MQETEYRVDKFGRQWPYPENELCSECGQPDSCGDCNHQPLSDKDVEEILGEQASKETEQERKGMTPEKWKQVRDELALEFGIEHPSPPEKLTVRVDRTLPTMIYQGPRLIALMQCDNSEEVAQAMVAAINSHAQLQARVRELIEITQGVVSYLEDDSRSPRRREALLSAARAALRKDGKDG